MAGEATTSRYNFLSAEVITAASGTAKQTVRKWREGTLLIKVESTGGTVPVLAIYVEVSDRNYSAWYRHPDFVHPYVITADGNYAVNFDHLCETLKVTWVPAGTDATFTVTMDLVVKS